MKRHIISKSQGTIVVLTVLIAVALGMTNPSTVLAGKPQFVVTVELNCGNSCETDHTTAIGNFYFYSSKGALMGSVSISCENTVPCSGHISTGTTDPMPTKPAYWVGQLYHTDPQNHTVAGAFCASTSSQYYPWREGTAEALECISPLDFKWRYVGATIDYPTPY